MGGSTSVSTRCSNRAILLFGTDSEAVRRIQEVCCRLSSEETAQASKRAGSVPLDVAGRSARAVTPQGCSGGGRHVALPLRAGLVGGLEQPGPGPRNGSLRRGCGLPEPERARARGFERRDCARKEGDRRIQSPGRRTVPQAPLRGGGRDRATWGSHRDLSEARRLCGRPGVHGRGLRVRERPRETERRLLERGGGREPVSGALVLTVRFLAGRRQPATSGGVPCPSASSAKSLTVSFVRECSTRTT